MLLALIHWILTVGLTVLYAVYGNHPQGFLGVLAYVGVILGFFIGVAALIVLVFMFVMLVFEKSDPRKMFKHRFMIAMAKYYYLVILRVRLVASGRENVPNHNRFVMYSNHIEASDPMYIKMLFKNNPMSFISKEILFKVPVVGQMLKSLGCIPISPGADRSAMNSILEGIERVKGGLPYGIFPEGRRTYSNDIIEFKPGSFKLATKAEADIIPVCVYGMHEINRKGRILPVTVRVHIFPAITPAEYQGVDTVVLAKRVEQLVFGKIAEFKRLESHS
ncbi:MAG: lysophospholipid acyltransferase family protein [bacterium]